MGMMKEFKEFAMRGNVVDMAVGIVIGAAFKDIVSALVDKIIMPMVGYITSGKSFAELSYTLGGVVEGQEPATIGYGAFIQTIIDFVIVAFAIF
ncbi:MAG: large conductance mechanosensitive channel protein MscL, partial [Planctomycetales bacterium]|nr:large conductance mechanosensitive channel protein MscL [Planctomycetales bacterium]